MKGRIFSIILIVSCFTTLLAQSEKPSGRWLFEAITDTGKKIPLLILQISTNEGTPEAAILSTSAPFEINVQGLVLDQNTFRLELEASQGELTFTGILHEDSIKGAIQGFAFNDYLFLAYRTQLEGLERLKEAAPEELQAFGQAMQVAGPQARIEAFKRFIGNHPDSPLKGQATLQIFKSLVRISDDDRELLAAAEGAIELADDRLTAMNDVAYALAVEERLLDQAEIYARKAVEGARENSPSQGAFLDTLGWVLFQRGQVEDAAHYLIHAYELAPDKGEVAFHLARVLEAEGNEHGARNLYLKVYVNGGNHNALKKVEELYVKEHGSLQGLHELIDLEYEKKAPLFEAEEYKGKTGGKVVLAELFTGSECGPCQAADYAFHGLLEHYPDSVVAVVKYHLHVPGPDPMTNSDTEKRANYYQVFGTPQAIFDGVNKKTGGGFAGAALNLFKTYQDIIDSQLDAGFSLQLDVQGNRENDVIRVKVRVKVEDNLSTENLRLRIALVEGTVHYTGSNRVHFHKQVVRKLLAGAEGLPLSTDHGGAAEFELTQDLTELESELEQYLKSFQKEYTYTFKELTYKIDRANLSVLAFVQNDENKKVLNAASVRLK
ncbi:MAG: hypothetical protein ACE5MK_07825 [Acidobacteriota bacterium]